MTRQTRDALTLRTADAIRVVAGLERAGLLAAAHTTEADAREIAECLRLIADQAQRARERIELWRKAEAWQIA